MWVWQRFWSRPKIVRFSFLFNIKEEVMSDEIKIDKTMDLKGLPCPQPVIKVNKGIKEIGVGQILEAITTDPGALSDFPAWARTSGNEILETEQKDGLIRFIIKRVK
jgi:tRNA 2-thiouridine synthesizing protein A